MPTPPAPARRGIWKIRRRPRLLDTPPDTPADAKWRYGIDFPFQVAPTVAGLYANVKIYCGPGQDFEGGVDIVLGESPAGIDGGRAVVVARNSAATNPNNGGRPCLLMKYPGLIGFVPLGAKLADGRPHPHAGTGFSLVTCAAWPADTGEVPAFALPDRIGCGPYTGDQSYRCFELRQLGYDGRNFTVGPAERIERDGLVDRFRFVSAGMGCALAEGEDLIVGLTAARHGGTATAVGLVRWRRTGGVWRPAAYDFATPEDNSVEPSLLRDLDGSLLLYARAPRSMGAPIRIWRQGAGGGPWELQLNLNGLIPNVALALNRAVDGTPYVVSNLYEPSFLLPPGLNSDGGISRIEPAGRRGERSTLCVWPLNGERNGFDAQLVLRDPRAEFGPPPHGTVWAADHPCGGVVRLADGDWHALVGWRLLEWKENSHQIPPGPRTGSYLDEILSFGDPVPLWNF